MEKTSGETRGLWELVISTALFLACTGATSAQDSIGSPAFRFIPAGNDAFTISAWDDDITVGIIGQGQDSGVLSALSLLEVYGQAAQYNVVSASTQPRGVPGTNGVELNYLFVFDENVDGSFSPDFLSDIETGIPNAQISTGLASAIGKPTNIYSPGCYGLLQVSDAGVISSFIGQIDINLPESDRYNCIEALVLTSLGLFPAVGQYELVVGDKEQRISFRDRSVSLLALSALGVCRASLNDFSLQCPQALTATILGAHGKF